MTGFARIIGELIAAHCLHIAGAIGAVILASEAYQIMTDAFTPVTHILG